MRTGLRNHRRHQRTERGIASARASRFAADVLEGIESKEQKPMREWTTQEPDKTMSCEHCGDDAYYIGTTGTGMFEGAVWTRSYRCPECQRESTQSMIVREA